jgi:two-component system sensor histidine kinase CpxA
VRSLFFKFFFSFLLIMVLAGAMSALVFHTFGKASLEALRQNFFREYDESIARFIVTSGWAAHDTYRYSGIEAYRLYVREFEAGTGTRLFLIAGDGNEISGMPVPAELLSMVTLARNSKDMQIDDQQGQLLVAGKIGGRDEDNFVIAGVHQKRPPPRFPGPPPGVSMPPPPMPEMGRGTPGPPLGLSPPMPPPPGGLADFFLGAGGLIRFAIMLLAAAGVCLLLARSFSAPLARLRRVTRQIAAGDFSARVGERLGGANDEITQLGKDFDTMAAATENMLLSRQRLLRDISHELRSPLARLNVALELARQRLDLVGDDKALATIGKESDRLNELIEHLLVLTRLENGEEGREQRQPVDVKSLVLRIVEDANFELGIQKRKIGISVLEDLCVEGSPELLHRAIENVVRNAARYTADQTEVVVSLTREDDQALLQVIDHGPGVPEEELDAIFQPFYRVAAARDRQSGGAGLGLAIAAQTVKGYRGRIEAINGEEGGLAVRIFLPLVSSCNWEKERQSEGRTG